MGRLDDEARTAMTVLLKVGQTQSAVARLLGVSEGAVRYHHRRRRESGATDGRSRQVSVAAVHAEAIAHWRDQQTDGRINLAALHDWLRREHGYGGSLKSVQAAGVSGRANQPLPQAALARGRPPRQRLDHILAGGAEIEQQLQGEDEAVTEIVRPERRMSGIRPGWPGPSSTWRLPRAFGDSDLGGRRGGLQTGRPWQRGDALSAVR